MVKETYIAMLSGGRDSTAMVELILRQGKPLDHIVFTDTLNEFPQMYEYLEKFDSYIRLAYGIGITYLKPRKTFEDWVFGIVTKGNAKGKVRGLPMIINPCFWKRESKVRPTERWVKAQGITNPVYYIGYTYSESKRSKVKDGNQVYPLIENRMCEADVDRLLESIHMLNPLYKFFDRTGCSFCPYMSDRAYYVVFNEFPKVWDYMKNIELKLMSMDNVANQQWSIDHTMEQREEIFKNSDGKYSVEASKSCECKVILPDTKNTIKP